MRWLDPNDAVLTFYDWLFRGVSIAAILLMLILAIILWRDK